MEYFTSKDSTKIAYQRQREAVLIHHNKNDTNLRLCHFFDIVRAALEPLAPELHTCWPEGRKA